MIWSNEVQLFLCNKESWTFDCLEHYISKKSYKMSKKSEYLNDDGFITLHNKGMQNQ